MNLTLDRLIPYSLKDRITTSNSAIWNQSVTFEKADIIKIEAPSGTGKTTLTHLLYKVRCDYTGCIKYGDLELSKCTEDDLANLRQNHLSIVFQDLRLFPDLSAIENIEIKRLLAPQFSSKELVNEMAEKLGISSILDQKIRFCSFGEQQRIAIIRALMQPFSWLILDEPFSHLDQENIKLASDLIESSCEQRNAGLIIMGLNKDHYFKYSKELVL
jgi:putative ABC transport system ATP-binding protein